MNRRPLTQLANQQPGSVVVVSARNLKPQRDVAADDNALRLYIETAWELVAPKRLRSARRVAGADLTREGA